MNRIVFLEAALKLFLKRLRVECSLLIDHRKRPVIDQRCTLQYWQYEIEDAKMRKSTDGSVSLDGIPSKPPTDVLPIWGSKYIYGAAPRYIIKINRQVDDSLTVLETLTHEIIHTLVGLQDGHGPAFRYAASWFGLELWPTSRSAGANASRFKVIFKDEIATLVESFGRQSSGDTDMPYYPIRCSSPGFDEVKLLTGGVRNVTIARGRFKRAKSDVRKAEEYLAAAKDREEQEKLRAHFAVNRVKTLQEGSLRVEKHRHEEQHKKQRASAAKQSR